jgi:competence protein ComEC
VSLVSALANAVAIPVITLGVVPLALLPIVVPIDAPWRLAHAVLEWLMRYLEWAAALPAATWVSHAPRPWTVAVAIGGVAWLMAPRGIPGRALGSLLLCPLALVTPPTVPVNGVRIVVLDVGQGLAVFVATAHHALLYDTGPRFNDAVDAGGRIILPFLRAAGVRRLDMLVISHADSDHAGGAVSILHGVPVAQTTSSLPANHALVAQAGMRGQSIRCIEGAGWTWDGVAFTILHPARPDYDDASRKSNDLSCVLKIDAAGGSALLTGDIEAASEQALLERDRRALRADVLVVPHHGSRTSTTRGFVDAVSATVAVIAAGYRNRFGHPRAEVLARYRRGGAARPRTDLQGAITVSITPEGRVTTYTERERRRRYWYDAPSLAEAW